MLVLLLLHCQAVKYNQLFDISKSKFFPKLLMSQSKFSGPRKFTLRYQQFEVNRVEMYIKIGNVS